MRCLPFFLNQGWIPSCLLCHLYMMDSSVSPLSAPPAKLLFPITFSSHPYKCIAGTESTTCIYISRQKSTQKVNMSSRQGRRTIVGLFYESQVSCTCRIRQMGMKQQRKVGERQRRNQDNYYCLHQNLHADYFIHSDVPRSKLSSISLGEAFFYIQCLTRETVCHGL